MARKEFNRLDKFISYLRLIKIKKYIKKNSSICDFGCGNGDLLVKLHEEFDFKLAIGVDAFASLSEHKKIKFIKKDISDTGLEDEEYDTLLMLALIEHIDLNKVDKVLSEAYRIIKPGGKIILTTPTPIAKPVLEFMAFKLKIISSDEIKDHKHYYSLGELSNLLIKRNFKKVSTKHFQFRMNALYVFEK
ncbi:hypothetical protein C0583_03760 [Candidatus Parcubacteria bacterium]|nr:MAG: hypothetical protein C0583_03760 [Candidatus Parcubacteria bacterium]